MHSSHIGSAKETAVSHKEGSRVVQPDEGKFWVSLFNPNTEQAHPQASMQLSGFTRHKTSISKFLIITIDWTVLFGLQVTSERTGARRLIFLLPAKGAI